MKSILCLIGIVLVQLPVAVFALSPEAARRELAQENIPYTPEALVNQVELGNTDVVELFLDIGMEVDTVNEFGEFCGPDRKQRASSLHFTI